LLTLEQKLSGIESLGIDYCIMIDFSDNFATLTGREFLTALHRGNVQFVAVGENFQFGYKLDTNAEKAYCIVRPARDALTYCAAGIV